MKTNKNQAPAAQVAAAATEEVKSAKKVSASQVKVDFFTPLINEGKHTANELFQMAVESGQFPKLKESTIRTFLTDSKNPKYNKFPKLVVKGEGGKLSFQKESK